MRFQRIALNLFSSLSRNVIGLLLGLMATPIILKHLGEESFGAYRVLVDWTTQLGLLELGLFTALLPMFAESLAQKTRLHPPAVASQAWHKYVYVLIYKLVGFVIIYAFLDYLVPISAELRDDLRLAGIILGVSLFFTFSQIYRAYIDASQRGYLLSTAMMIQNALYVGLAILFAIMDAGIAGQAFAFTISVAINFLILYFYSYQELESKRSKASDRRSFKLSLRRQRTSNFLAQICGSISLLADNLIISAFLGAKAVTAFYLTQRLLQIASQQLQQLGNSTWPAMSEIYYSKDREKFANRIVEVTEFIAFASGALLTVACLLNPAFVKLWTGEGTFAGLTLSNIVIANCGLFAINSFWLWCFQGTGFIAKTIPMLATQAAVNLLVSLTGTYFFGIIGPVLGTLVSFLFVSQIWTTLLLKQQFQVPAGLLTFCWLWPFAAPVGITIVLTSLYGTPTIDSWLGLALWSVILSVIVLASFPLIFVRPSSRRRIYQRVAESMHKKFMRS